MGHTIHEESRKHKLQTDICAVQQMKDMRQTGTYSVVRKGKRGLATKVIDMVRYSSSFFS